MKAELNEHDIEILCALDQWVKTNEGKGARVPDLIKIVSANPDNFPRLKGIKRGSIGPRISRVFLEGGPLIRSKRGKKFFYLPLTALGTVAAKGYFALAPGTKKFKRGQFHPRETQPVSEEASHTSRIDHRYSLHSSDGRKWTDRTLAEIQEVIGTLIGD